MNYVVFSHSKTQYIPPAPDRGCRLHVPLMATLYAMHTVILLASAVLMTRGEEWQTLAGLSIGAAVGGVFGLLYTAFSKKSNPPWQIMVWRGVLNILGGIGFGTIAVLLEVKWWGLNPGPLLTIATGFVTSWLAVGIATVAEPRLIKILEDRGDLALPPTRRTIDLTTDFSTAPTTKLIPEDK